MSVNDPVTNILACVIDTLANPHHTVPEPRNFKSWAEVIVKLGWIPMTEPLTEAEFIAQVKRDAFQRFGHEGAKRVLGAMKDAPGGPYDAFGDIKTQQVGLGHD